MLAFGTRPEAIKMLPVVTALRAHHELEVVVTATGQHRQMLDQVFAAFGESPDIDLDLMSEGQPLSELTSRVLTRMTGVVKDVQPDLVLVHGDTTTAMASALACFYAKCRIGHVEAGLRSHDLDRPWPEEFNRVCIDAVADLLFAPTRTAADNLTRESQRPRDIYVTGNTGIDALLYMADQVSRQGQTALPVDLSGSRRLVLVTGHRRESFGGGFLRICEALARIAERQDVEIVYPVHLNPQVKDVVEAKLGARDNVHLLPPVSYVEMVDLMQRAHIILTDSGGIQEEGPALGKPVLVMREVTERPEAVETGVVKLVGTDVNAIVDETFRLLDDATHYQRMARPVFPYGDGTAAAQIADIIASHWGLQ